MTSLYQPPQESRCHNAARNAYTPARSNSSGRHPSGQHTVLYKSTADFLDSKPYPVSTPFSGRNCPCHVHGLRPGHDNNQISTQQKENLDFESNYQLLPLLQMLESRREMAFSGMTLHSSAAAMSSLTDRALLAPAGSQCTKSMRTHLAVRAQKSEERMGSNTDQQQQQLQMGIALDRRETLKLGLAMGVSAFGSVFLPLEEANAADLTQRFQRGAFLQVVREKLRVAVKDNQNLVPALLRLALNDALTYDKESKSGGANGSIIFELDRPENRGLKEAVTLLEGVKKEVDAEFVSKGGPISWADLIHLAAQSATKRTFIDAAIRKCGGNEQKGLQLYQAYGSNGQWGQFDKLLGRSDAAEADPSGRVLLWEDASPQEIKERFAQLGIKPRQIAVLSAFLGPSQAKIEEKLVADPEFTQWVKKYKISRETVSQTDYEVDLITIFTRLSVLGQAINYEAYSYKLPPKPFRF
ncbi:hypothetical protein R1sor_003642 [Riccia sorocarpa]|uniref:Plant heme peroxidase family profile domain-containing protein n=1 Tax=Riccia sorocarpa TaxID=122646 RepID=A0ABD3H264_9MARC